MAAQMCMAAVCLPVISSVLSMDPEMDYVIQVTASCGQSPAKQTSIAVLADLPEVQPVAVCRYGHMFPLRMVSLVQWEISASADESPDSGCLFTVTAIPSLDDSSMPPYLVSCVYAKHIKGDTSSRTVASEVTPTRVLELVGPLSRATVNVQLIDVFNQPVKDAELGQTVRLEAELTDSAEEAGMKPEYCYAAGDNNSTYYILQTGCGDGAVIAKNRGFLTTGTRVISPYFRFFGLPGSSTVTFHCLFVLCTEECNGSSCEEGELPGVSYM